MDSVLICGMGCVGRQILNTFIYKCGAIRKIGLLSTNENKADGIIMDWRQVLFAVNPSLILENAGRAAELSSYSVCFVCVGLPESKDYPAYVLESLKIIEDTVLRLRDKGFRGHLIIVSNPNDAATTYVGLMYNKAFKSIIGTSTNLDSFRLAALLSEKSSDLNYAVVGKHGRFCVPVGVALSGKEREELERKGEMIVSLKNHSDVGVAFSCLDIYESLSEKRKFVGAIYDEAYGCAFGWVLMPKDGTISKVHMRLGDENSADLDKGIKHIKADVESYIKSKQNSIS
ncbi:MAG: hypothetical protein HFK09_06275 [Clostridia bacterium]|nr:hypothetical protein [Clostridia bacterium]